VSEEDVANIWDRFDANNTIGVTRPRTYYEWLMKNDRSSVRRDNLDAWVEYCKRVFAPTSDDTISSFALWPTPQDFDREIEINMETGCVSFPSFYRPDTPDSKRVLKWKQPMVRSMANAQLREYLIRPCFQQCAYPHKVFYEAI
jgi:hypothetical protein